MSDRERLAAVLVILREIADDIRSFHATDDGTDKHPDHQYLTEDIEARLDVAIQRGSEIDE
jgi:hypothetical protein